MSLVFVQYLLNWVQITSILTEVKKLVSVMNTSVSIDVHLRVSELACDAESISYTNIHLYPSVYVQARATIEERERVAFCLFRYVQTPPMNNRTTRKMASLDYIQLYSCFFQSNPKGEDTWRAHCLSRNQLTRTTVSIRLFDTSTRRSQWVSINALREY